MGKVLFSEVCCISNEKIQELSVKAEEACKKFCSKNPKEVKRASLTLEEILLNFQKKFGAEHSCTVICKKVNKQIRFRIEDVGEKNNPLEVENDNESINILEYLGIGTRYKYSSHKNIVCFSISTDKKNRSIRNIVISFVLAIVLGMICLQLPEKTCEALSTNIIGPLFQKAIAILSAVASPMIFLAVILGIVGLEDVTTIGSIGKTLLKGMLLTYAFASGCMVVVSRLFLNNPSELAGNQTGVGDLMQLVLDIIPGNLIEPFATDNHLQIIALAVFVGVILLLLGDTGKKVTSALKEISVVINRMMMTICIIIPFIVFLGVFNIVISNQLSKISSIWKTIVIFYILSFVTISFVVIRTRVVTGLKFPLIIKKQYAPLMVNLTTSSQVAAFPYSTECCKKHYGIDEKLVDFALPIEMVVYMPCGAVAIGLTACTLAMIDGVALTPLFLIKCFFLAIIIAIAAPPIPGSFFVVLSIVISGMGLSNEGMPSAVIIGTICGYFLPLFNGFLLELELLIAAYKEKKVDIAVMNDHEKV